MDLATRVNALVSTTFSGRRFTRQQIIDVAQTVELYPKLSRSELALTLCEHLKWNTPGHELKINSALELLDKLESLEICRPPALKLMVRRPAVAAVSLAVSSDPPPIEQQLATLSPITLQVVGQAERQRFDTAMARYHYLGHKRPFGAFLRYFILDKDGRELGLMLFAASAWALKSRDEWIGWERRHRLKRLNLVVSNSRFLIFPWVNVPNLASKALSLVTARLADDWQGRYGYRPVLIETFVDREKYLGTCYQAANWLNIGQTAGRGRFDRDHTANKSVKDIYVTPLVTNFRDVLLRGDSLGRQAPVADDMRDKLCRIHDKVLSFWDQVAPLIRNIAEEFDASWQVKRRVIDSMLLVLVIFRLVATRAKHGYGTTIDELWDNCRKQGVPLPQKKPIAASSFGAARLKLDEQIFKTINSRVIACHAESFDRPEHRFHGHRLYAVDGSKLNLPHALIHEGFKAFQKNAHYPQGLLSALYNLRAQIPVDFVLSQDHNERRVARDHLACLVKGDIVVYDRGYFSYGFLHAHEERGIHGVFRLSKTACTAVKDFVTSGEMERFIALEPKDADNRADVRKANPGIDIKPLPLRLIRYEIGGESYFLGTTLLDQEKYPREVFPDLYGERWGIEGLYKISKQLIAIEEFHSKSARGVKQELYAHLTLITLNRIFTIHADEHPSGKGKAMPKDRATKMTSNFKNSMAAVARNLESLMLAHVSDISETLLAIVSSVSRRTQRARPGRNYARRSLQPKSKWQTFKTRVSKAAKGPFQKNKEPDLTSIAA